ncbi:MAG: hypothetical protein K8I30_00925 [Anaerolineae bacterium]|nr:hypothetical protein [Anaerolineae bacterium]
MSITWFITPYDPKFWEDPDDMSEKPTSDLHIDFFIYYKRLLEKWPEATIENSGESYHAYLICNADSLSLRVSLFSKNQIIAIDNNPTPCFFEFVLFHRLYVPINYPLYFFNSSAWDSLELKADTTEKDIRQFMGYTGE